MAGMYTTKLETPIVKEPGSSDCLIVISDGVFVEALNNSKPVITQGIEWVRVLYRGDTDFVGWIRADQLNEIKW